MDEVASVTEAAPILEEVRTDRSEGLLIQTDPRLKLLLRVSEAAAALSVAQRTVLAIDEALTELCLSLLFPEVLLLLR